MQDHQLEWHTASYSSGGGDCVEVARTPAVVLVRDSKDRGGVRLHVDTAQWQSFTDSIQAGQFE